MHQYTQYTKWAHDYETFAPNIHLFLADMRQNIEAGVVKNSLLKHQCPICADQAVLACFQIEPTKGYQLFEACVWQRTMVGSCIMAEFSAGLEALSWAKAASVSGKAGGVAGVFVGTHDACYTKKKDEEKHISNL